MAEAFAVLGVIASIVQLADLGCKLSIKLFSFSQTVSSADDTLKSISSDVSITSTVLQELAVVLKADESSLISPNAISTMKQALAECLNVFDQLDAGLEEALGNRKGRSDARKKRNEKGRLSTVDKLKWPFREPKMELLRRNLDRLKASLSLMLQVLSYARDVAAKSTITYQKELIEALARNQQAAEERYLAWQSAIQSESGNIPPFHNLVTSPIPDGKPSNTNLTSNELDSTHESQNIQQPSPSEQSIINETLVCLQLLEDLISIHCSVRTDGKLSALGYEQLFDAVEGVRSKELVYLESIVKSAENTDNKYEVINRVISRLTQLSSKRSSTTRQQFESRIYYHKTELRTRPAQFLDLDSAIIEEIDSVPSVTPGGEKLRGAAGYTKSSVPTHSAPMDSGNYQEGEYEDDDNEYESDDENDNIVQELLSKWTLLPIEKHDGKGSHSEMDKAE